MMIKKYLWAILSIVSISMPVYSAVITADATGFDSDTVDFWGVSFDSGNGFIKSIEFDLSPLTGLGISFDFDGVTSPGPLNLIEPLIGDTVGFTSPQDDIKSVFDTPNPTILTFNFGVGAFGLNDSFKFTADTDGTQLLSGALGEHHAGLLFTVLMEDGSTVTDSFSILEQLSVDGSSKSGVSITTPSVVPVPATVWLFGSGLLAIAVRRKKTSSCTSLK